MTHGVIFWSLVAVLLVLVAVQVVPFVLADGQTRRSMWQARLIRWRWRRLARMLGLTVSDPTQTVISVFVGERGQLASPPRPRILYPRIRVKADAYGVVVRARTLPKVGRDEWVKASGHLANAWGCVRVAVTQERPGRLVVRAVRRDPLTEPYVYVPTVEPPAELDRWEIGRDEYAQPTMVRLSNVPGISIAGLPGYGKTSVINSLVARLAPSPAVQLAVVDGKGGADYEDLTGRFFAWSGDELAAANAIFRRLYELRRQRAECIRSVLGVKNLWHVGPSERWPLVVLVIDEAHTFLADVKGDKDLMALTAENRRLVEDIVKKGRSVGICTVLATQKSTGDAIPTAIRDVCPVALSFAQRTDEAAVAALGADIRHYPEANPVALQDPAYVGVASMVVQGRPGFTRVRTPYVSDADVARICTSTAGLTRDPSSLLAEADHLPRIVPGFNEAGPAWGGDRSAGPRPGRDDQDAEDAA
jgi:DNA segregation ATPase FtsK/SpoIIIE, S-DNA-T family